MHPPRASHLASLTAYHTHALSSTSARFAHYGEQAVHRSPHTPLTVHRWQCRGAWKRPGTNPTCGLLSSPGKYFGPITNESRVHRPVGSSQLFACVMPRRSDPPRPPCPEVHSRSTAHRAPLVSAAWNGLFLLKLIAFIRSQSMACSMPSLCYAEWTTNARHSAP